MRGASTKTKQALMDAAGRAVTARRKAWFTFRGREYFAERRTFCVAVDDHQGRPVALRYI
ncbi:MAG: hypothetical protein U5S82_00330 [Gammaproteobacteria bacterium]|nr:hypothetical protein [Gammaproteobacteria bacterium]